MDKDPFKEYMKQSEPNKRDKCYKISAYPPHVYKVKRSVRHVLTL